MNRANTKLRSALVVCIGLSMLVAPGLQAAPKGGGTSTATGASDDLFLLTTSVSPNVILVLDNSGSMDEIEWHEAFDPAAGSYGCSDFSNTSTYYVSSTANYTFCGNTRKVYAPVTNTRWNGRYLNWYFSDAADAYETDIQTAKAVISGCQKAGGSGAFDDKYRRTRFQAAQQVVLDLLCFAEPKGIRFGLALFRDPADSGGVDPNGGYVSLPIDRSNPSHAADLEAKVKNLAPTTWTPLGETLFQIYTYYMSRTLSDIPDGKDASTAFPRYEYSKDGDYETNSSKWVDDPIEASCSRSFVIVVTDGEPARDDFDRDPNDTARGFDDFKDELIGDYNPDGENEVPGDTNESGWYLDDIAKYMQENDFRPDMAGDQKIDTYTVGFATEAKASALLQKTADMGNGTFWFAKTGDQLAQALNQALNDIVEKSQSFTAASVPSARTADGGDFYQSFFFPLGSTAFWEGHLRSWHITANGDVQDKAGNCALDDPDPGECNSGSFKPSAVYFWDAFDEVPMPASRTLKTSKLVAGTPTMVNFDVALTAADLDVAPFAAPPDPSPNNALYPLNGSTALNEEGLADEVVQFARGCLFGTGVSTADVSAPSTCAARPARFGDIFHSNPAIVRQPRRTTPYSSNAVFRAAYANRSRRIYVGTNGGFLESINAGSWDVMAVPPKYDAGTGEEEFGFMPWPARQAIKNQPVDPSNGRTYYVDGTPQVADVRLYANATVEAHLPNEWRSVLVGGLRQGGRTYYALDVTNPDGVVGPAGNLPYPGYLWEFPREDDPDNPANSNSYLPFMGETWGQPIITRIKVKVNGNDNGGYGYSRWVAIVTGGYDPTGDPNNAGNYVANGTKGRSIYVIDIKTGKVIAEKRYDAGASDGAQYMKYAIPSTPGVLDLNNDGFADMVVVGDLGGQVFKWLIGNLGEDRVNDGSGLRTQPNWTFKRFFSAPPATISGQTYYKSIFFPPGVAYVANKIWYAFSTGERAQIAFAGVAGDDSENNRFYVIQDNDLYETAVPARPTLFEVDLTNVSATDAATAVATEGYYFVGADGEKFVTNTEVFAGTVITASFTPDFTGDPCTSRGNGTIYAFDLVTGEGYFADGAGNPDRSIDGGTGMPTDPKTSTGPNGKDNRVYIEKSDTEMLSFGAEDLDLSKSGLYWRER